MAIVFTTNVYLDGIQKSSGGEACPLCRKTQDLPEPVYSSSEEESDFEVDVDSDNSNDSDESEDEETRTIRNEMIQCRQKRALQFFLKTNKDTESTISLNCKACKTDILDCDFCSDLICSCKKIRSLELPTRQTPLENCLIA